MRVIQVIPHTRLGGMQQVAYHLNESLPRQGIESTVLDLEVQTTTSADGRRRRPGALARAWFQLIRRWKAERPDAVIAHTVKNAVYSLTAARVAGIRGRVAVVHSNRRTLGRQRVFLIVALAYAGVITDVIFVGEADADSFSGLPRRVKRLCRTIQNGVQLPAAPQKGGAASGDGGTIHLISAGRLVPGKNIQAIVRAVAVASTPVTLDICGDGPLRGELEHLAIRLGAPVRFHGKVDHAALLLLYAASDIFLFPTKGEGLPLVLIEAAVAGLPAIVSEYPFNREVMGDSALYCNADSVQEWTSAIERLGGDTRLRSSMTSAGLARADHFSVDRMTAEYARLLKNRLGKTA